MSLSFEISRRRRVIPLKIKRGVLTQIGWNHEYIVSISMDIEIFLDERNNSQEVRKLVLQYKGRYPSCIGKRPSS